MLATLVAVCKDRDAKVELNRRNQACEVLADTGTSRRVKNSDVFCPALGTGIGQHIPHADAPIDPSFNR
jgi:hypothetical protein